MSAREVEAPNDAARAATTLRARVGRRVGGLAGAALVVTAAPALLERWPVARALELACATGLVACAALLGALSISPLSALMRGPRGLVTSAPVLRRALGMAAAWLGLVHAGVAFVGPLAAKPSALLQTSHLYAGLGALAILLVLLLTSYAGVVRVLRLRAWKELHRLSYLAALLVVQHVALSAFADRRLVLALLAVVAGLLGARLLTVLRNERRTG